MKKNIYKAITDGAKKARELKKTSRKTKDLRRKLKSMQAFDKLVNSFTLRS